METGELDKILGEMIVAHPGVSDLFFVVGRPLQVESFGVLCAVGEGDVLDAEQTEGIAKLIIGTDTRLRDDLLRRGSSLKSQVADTSLQKFLDQTCE